MIFDIIENSTFVGGLIINPDNIYHTTQAYQGKFKVNLLKENLIEIASGLLMPRNHFLFAQTNQAITKLSEGGIMQRWVNNALNHTARIVESGPKVLTMSHLGIGFLIWIIFLSLGLPLLIVEKCTFLCRG